jgi:Tetratricopeptide repeat
VRTTHSNHLISRNSTSGNARGKGPAVSWVDSIEPKQSCHDLESQSIYRELAHRWGIANSRLNLGEANFDQGDHPAARRRFEESLPIMRDLGNQRGIAYALNVLGEVAFGEGAMLPLRCGLTKRACGSNLTSSSPSGAERAPPRR